MRIWSLAPEHLDRAGLVAGWREALLAQAVLAGRTKGYRNHPQLQRFRTQATPIDAIGIYLRGLLSEAEIRGYRFDAGKILSTSGRSIKIAVTAGQIEYEWAHLGGKLAKRSPEYAQRWRASVVSPHPLFEIVPGEIEPWERV